MVGAGVMGRHHADAIQRVNGKLAAVVDPHLERARKVAGDVPVFRSLDELGIRPAGIDVVHVCVPLAAHAEVVEQAIGLGAHAIVEKPLAADAGATAALLSAAERQGLIVLPVHQFAFQRGFQRILARRQRFGSVVRCVFEAATAGAELTNFDADELVADVLPHPLSLFSHFAPIPVSGLEWLATRPAPGELRALATCRGATFEIVISTRGRPTRAAFDLLGTRGSAHADLFHGFAVMERGAATRSRKLVRPFGLAGATFGRAAGNLAVRSAIREAAYPGLRELIRRTYAAIAAGSPAPIAAREILGVARARDTIIKAAAAPAPGRTPL